MARDIEALRKELYEAASRITVEGYKVGYCFLSGSGGPCPEVF